jgi:hypothetical protein
MCLLSCWEWEAELINSGKSRQAAEDSSRHARAGPPGLRFAQEARLLAFCAHFSYLRSQASKHESRGMKINLELKRGRGCFILSGFPGCPAHETLGERQTARASGQQQPLLFPPPPPRFLDARGRGCQGLWSQSGEEEEEELRNGIGQEAVLPAPPPPPRLESVGQEDPGRLAGQGGAESALQLETNVRSQVSCFLRCSDKGRGLNMERGVQQAPKQARLPQEGGGCFQMELGAEVVAKWQSACWHGLGLSFQHQHYKGSWGGGP